MKRFRFRLEKVLSLRHQETDQAKRGLGVAISEEEAARRDTENADAVLNARVTEIRRREREGMVAFDFVLLRAHIKVLQQDLQAVQAALAQAQQVTQTRRQQLMVARRRERSLERLRERRMEEHVAESLREEQKELDQFGDRQGLNIASARSDI